MADHNKKNKNNSKKEIESEDNSSQIDKFPRSKKNV